MHSPTLAVIIGYWECIKSILDCAPGKPGGFYPSVGT